MRAPLTPPPAAPHAPLPQQLPMPGLPMPRSGGAPPQLPPAPSRTRCRASCATATWRATSWRRCSPRGTSRRCRRSCRSSRARRQLPARPRKVVGALGNPAPLAIPGALPTPTTDRRVTTRSDALGNTGAGL
nr:uncharacterized protein LOC113802352 isoform X1 [Penaeus vannamei]